MGSVFYSGSELGCAHPSGSSPRPLTSLLLRTLPVLPRASPWRFPRGQELLVGLHSLDVDTGISPHSCLGARQGYCPCFAGAPRELKGFACGRTAGPAPRADPCCGASSLPLNCYLWWPPAHVLPPGGASCIHPGLGPHRVILVSLQDSILKSCLVFEWIRSQVEGS